MSSRSQPTNPVRRAVIDVGTNSVKLLLAEVSGRHVRPLVEESRQTRLGQGLYQNRRLQPGPIQHTARAVADFAAQARAQHAESVRVLATSAARDALNARDLVAAVTQASGLKVEIISGEEEADLGFRGVTSDPTLAQAPLLLVDVGGGSTQSILGQGEQRYFRRSFPIGTVRLLEKLRPGDPPGPEELAACRQWVQQFLRKEVQPGLAPALDKLRSQPSSISPSSSSSETGGDSRTRTRTKEAPAVAQRSVPRPSSLAPLLVGVGGTASILGCMEARLETFDRQRLEATRLSQERLRRHVERLWGLTLEERKKIIGLPPNRADVILMGAAIYEAMMQQLGFLELRLSTRGLRFAALMSERDA